LRVRTSGAAYDPSMQDVGILNLVHNSSNTSIGILYADVNITFYIP